MRPPGAAAGAADGLLSVAVLHTCTARRLCTRAGTRAPPTFATWRELVWVCIFRPCIFTFAGVGYDTLR